MSRRRSCMPRPRRRSSWYARTVTTATTAAARTGTTAGAARGEVDDRDVVGALVGRVSRAAIAARDHPVRQLAELHGRAHGVGCRAEDRQLARALAHRQAEPAVTGEVRVVRRSADRDL